MSEKVEIAPVVRAPSSPRTGSARSDAIAMAIVVGALILAMEVASRYVQPFIMPSPVAVLRAFWTDLTQDTRDIAITLLRLFAALGFAMLLGVTIGVLMGTSARLRPYLRSLVVIDTGIPALSWMLVAVFWFKEPEARIFFILTVILLPFYAMNVYEGIRAVPKDWVDMLESFRPSRWQVMRFLIIPQIVPYVLLTTKSLVGYATRMVIFAELIASAVGIGARMGLAQSTFKMEHVLAWTFFLVVFNLLAQGLVGLVEKRLLRWRPEANVR